MAAEVTNVFEPWLREEESVDAMLKLSRCLVVVVKWWRQCVPCCFFRPIPPLELDEAMRYIYDQHPEVIIFLNSRHAYQNKKISLNPFSEEVVLIGEHIMGEGAFQPAPTDASELYLAVDEVINILFYTVVVAANLTYNDKYRRFRRLRTNLEKIAWVVIQIILMLGCYIMVWSRVIPVLMVSALSLTLVFDLMNLSYHKILVSLGYWYQEIHTVFNNNFQIGMMYMNDITRQLLSEGPTDLTLIKEAKRSARAHSENYTMSFFEPGPKYADAYHAAEEDLTCPITQELMWDPVMAEDCQTYERLTLLEWYTQCLQTKGVITSPMTGTHIGAKVQTERKLWKYIDEAVEKRLALRSTVQKVTQSGSSYLKSLSDVLKDGLVTTGFVKPSELERDKLRRRKRK